MIILPYIQIIFYVENDIYQHQHYDSLISEHWLAVLKHFQVKTESLVIRNWHELNHGTEIIILKYLIDTV